jgi:hypothetical protein
MSAWPIIPGTTMNLVGMGMKCLRRAGKRLWSAIGARHPSLGHSPQVSRPPRRWLSAESALQLLTTLVRLPARVDWPMINRVNRGQYRHLWNALSALESWARGHPGVLPQAGMGRAVGALISQTLTCCHRPYPLKTE